MVEMVLRVMGSDLQPDIRSEATNEIKCQYLSAAKARERLGWKPLFELEAGMKRTVDWYRGHLASQAR